MTEDDVARAKKSLENYLGNHIEYNMQQESEDTVTRVNDGTRFLIAHGYPFPVEYYFHFNIHNKLCLCIDIHLGIIYPGNEEITAKAACELRESTAVDGIYAMIAPECTFRDCGIGIVYEFEIGKREMTEKTYGHIFSLVTDSLYEKYYPQLTIKAAEGFRDDGDIVLKKRMDAYSRAKYLEIRKLDKVNLEMLKFYNSVIGDEKLLNKIRMISEDLPMKRGLCLFLGEAMSSHDIEDFYKLTDNEEELLRILNMAISECFDVRNGILVFKENTSVRRFLEEDIWDTEMIDDDSGTISVPHIH